MLTTFDLVIDEMRETEESYVTPTVQDKQYILRAIDDVLATAERNTRRSLAPRLETRKFDALPMSCNGLVYDDLLFLDAELLTASSITVEGSALAASAYTLLPQEDKHKTKIQIIDGSWLGASVPADAIAVAGVWAYHTQPSEAWLNSMDTVRDTPLSSSSRTITVTDIKGEDERFETPRFSPGQLLKIGSEYMQVRKVTISVAATPVHTISVMRGVRGTTAAEYAQGEPITIWRPDPSVRYYATRWAAYKFQHRGQFIKTQVDGMTAIEWPVDMPDESKLFFASLVRLARIKKV